MPPKTSAPSPAPSGSALREFAVGMAILWLLWVFGGGPSRAKEADQPFLKAPDPLNTGQDYGILPDFSGFFSSGVKKNVGLDGDNNTSVRSEATISLLRDKDANKDFIEIIARSTNKKPINITGWKIKGITDLTAREVGQGTLVFAQGKVSDMADILLYPGDRALVLAGESPVGASFKLNKCIGYLEQFQVFTPHLPQSCPNPALDSGSKLYSDANCDLFLKSVMRCNVYVKEFPSQVTDNCKKIVDEELNYNSCVAAYSATRDFSQKEWRVYLGGSDELGSEDGDVISIFDQKSALIDTIFYRI